MEDARRESRTKLKRVIFTPLYSESRIEQVIEGELKPVNGQLRLRLVGDTDEIRCDAERRVAVAAVAVNKQCSLSDREREV